MSEMTGGFGIASGGYSADWLEVVVDEKAAAGRILRQLYPGGAACSVCGQTISGRRPLETFYRGDRTWCKSCESKFSPLTGTILSGAHMTFCQYEILQFCYSLPHVSDDQRIKIATDLTGLHSDTIKTWFSKLRFWESAGV